MPSPTLCTNADVFTFMGITAPTPAQTALMTMLRTGVEKDIINYARWAVVETAMVVYLPRPNVAHGSTVYTSDFSVGAAPSRTRLQLPQMYITTITDIWEDTAAIGTATGSFSSDTKLTANVGYHLETDDAGVSWNGGVLRVGATWSNIPGTIKASFTCGFSESALAGSFYDLRLKTIQEVADIWVTRQCMQQVYVTGLNGDTSGTVAREKLGPWEIAYRDPGASSSVERDGSSLSERIRCFLQDNGYVYCGVGV